MPTAQKIKFVCEHCQKTVRIAERHAGRKGKCPKCREPIRVPGKRTSTSSSTSKGRGSVKARPRKTSQRESSARESSEREEKECPSCGEFVLKKARKCRECDHWFKRRSSTAGRVPQKRKRSGGAAAAGGFAFGGIFIVLIILKVLGAMARASNAGY